eukprot:snap_masked-scaffold_19-processed-gene-5.21-mRNA-1 protein AED:1.00 eAED:1.00 QI:0/-1/0/0/-1/1/1/0/304
MFFSLFLFFFPIFLNQVNASAQIPSISGNFSYQTTKYSNFIGKFSKNCSISAPMIKLARGENLCNLDTIQTNITGKVLVTFTILNFGCYEEISYENAVKLGAIAVLDSAPIPPGSSFHIHNFRQNFRKGNIPFLQTGTEFFSLFAIEGLSLGFDVLNETEIKINGCGDISQIIKCNGADQKIYMSFSFIALFGIYLARKSLKKIKSTASSKPRVFLIIYESIFLFFTCIILFFGLELKQAKNLLRGNIISAQIKDILGILQLIGNIHGSLMNAIYWNALRKGCFLKESKLSKYWRKEFFFLLCN